jgi:ATP-dependent DNA helicase RecG
MAELADGGPVTVLAEIAEITSRRMRERRGSLLTARITDGSGAMSVTFFNQAWRERELRVGRRGLFSGVLGTYRGERQLTHPRYLLFPDGVEADPEAVEAFTNSLIPVYPATAKVTSWDIAKSMRVVLDVLPTLPDPLPEDIRSRLGLMDHDSAVRAIHRPVDRDEAERARKRLAFDEAVVLQASLLLRRRTVDRLTARPIADVSDGYAAEFDRQLPFTLTSGQISVGREIHGDLSRNHPMHRLLQGDVGSGKTLVALRAMLRIVDSGSQAALLAPTEVLASQHAQSITSMLGDLAAHGMAEGLFASTGMATSGVRVELLTGSLGVAARRQVIERIASGEANIIVGTHALFSEHIDFPNLALVVVDEQHRFGVEQRSILSERAMGDSRPHVLVMTATPIPRTVAMTVFGDLDVSALTEMPGGRADISTHVVNPVLQPQHLERVWQRVTEEIAQGHRVFVVCPRIGVEEPDDLFEDATDAAVDRVSASVTATFEMLQREMPNARIAMLHGRMGAEEKANIMQRLRAEGDTALDLVVATTVIEVGVDVPEATMMVIMDADRFGISQLHQLRGRIGRGKLPGVCIMISEAQEGTPARARLDAVASTRDGFVLAESDLEIRGEGDVLGDAQSGIRSSLKILSVLHDEELITSARDEVLRLLDRDPELVGMQMIRAAVERLDPERGTFLERA